MTPTPPGSGWWLASDGRWYPPDVAPGRPLPPPLPGATPVPPAPPNPFVPPGGVATWVAAPFPAMSAGLAGTLQGCYWTTAALSGATAVSSLVTAWAFDAWWDGPQDVSEYDRWHTLDAGWGALQGLTIVGQLVAQILLVIWMFKTSKLANALHPGPRRWTNGWTIGGWFIPLANAVIPKLVMNELERIVTAPRTAGVVHPEWRHRPTAAVGWVWWIATVAGSIGFLDGQDRFEEWGEEIVTRDLTGAYLNAAWTSAILTVAAVAGALMVRRMTRSMASAPR